MSNVVLLIFSLLFAAFGLGLHVRRLPVQNLMAIGLLVFAGAAAAEWSSGKWGFPYAALRFAHNPFWPIILSWIGALMVSRAIAQAFLAHHRNSSTYGLWVLGFTAAITSGMWGLVEAWLGAFRFINAVGRMGVAIVLLLLIFPWLIEKRPMRNNPAT